MVELEDDNLLSLGEEEEENQIRNERVDTTFLQMLFYFEKSFLNG